MRPGKTHESCSKRDGVCIKYDGFPTKTDGFCISNEARARLRQGLSAAQVASLATEGCNDLQAQDKVGAATALSAARVAREKLIAQSGGKMRYRAVKPGVIRQGIDAGTEKVGNLAVGEEVTALYEAGNRVRTSQGWVSKASGKGAILLAPLSDRVVLPLDTVHEYAQILFVAITDVDAAFDSTDGGQASLGQRLHYDEFVAYLANAPASSAIFAETTVNISDFSAVKAVWETVDKTLTAGVHVDGFVRVLMLPALCTCTHAGD